MKKSLLTEAQIRKFMKFADLGPLTENFIDKIEEEKVDEEKVDEDKIEETVWGGNKGDESATHPGEEDYTTKKGDELKHDEPGGRGEKKGDEAYVNEEEVLTEEDVDVHDLVVKLMQVISDETGVDVNVEEEEGGDVEDVGLEDEEVVDDEVIDDEVIDDEVVDDEVVDTEEEAVSIAGDDELEGGEIAALEGLVAEVTRRVAARLLKGNTK